jgi:DNA-binding response OmpR family regulator
MLKYQHMESTTQATSNNKIPKKVLIIEDDTSMLHILAYKISEEGFQVLEAQDGKSGLELAISEEPNLILLDLLLPKLDGLHLLEALRKNEKSKQIPVFILTNLSENDTIYKSVALKADAYFIKSDSSLEHIAAEVKNKLSPVK